MQASYTRNAAEFLDAAGAYLLEEPARNQLILGILGAVRDQPDLYESYEAWFVKEGGETVAAASMTAPWNLVLADATSHWAVEPLAAAIAETGSHVPGVVGNRPTVDRFGDAWTVLHGCTMEVQLDQGVLVCEQVAEMSPPEGGSRPMRPSERDLVGDWFRAFIDEALPAEAPDADRVAMFLDHSLDENREQEIWVWDLHGRPVSISRHSSFSFGASRIGPVYTPPEHRGNGYGTALVADQTRHLLSLGLDRVCLYTDLANETSNAIYESIGYEQVAESLQAAFSYGD